MTQDPFYEMLARWSQILGALAFIVVLVYLFRKFLTPAVAAAEASKNAEIEDMERGRALAQADLEVARRETADTASRAASIRDRGTRDAASESERILAEAKADGERSLVNAEGELVRARASANERLRARILEHALEIAREGAAKRVDAATNDRIIESVIGSIENDGAPR
jgi:F0F1-type ATP synthase membrane subunit b/b'